MDLVFGAESGQYRGHPRHRGDPDAAGEEHITLRADAQRKFCRGAVMSTSSPARRPCMYCEPPREVGDRRTRASPMFRRASRARSSRSGCRCRAAGCRGAPPAARDVAGRWQSRFAQYLRPQERSPPLGRAAIRSGCPSSSWPRGGGERIDVGDGAAFLLDHPGNDATRHIPPASMLRL